MRACTAVVTEISHHTKKTIIADVSFLSESEWRQELDVLLQDLVDEDGNLKRSMDLNSEAGIAWQKVLLTAVLCILHRIAYVLPRFMLSTHTSYRSSLSRCRSTT